MDLDLTMDDAVDIPENRWDLICSLLLWWFDKPGVTVTTDDLQRWRADQDAKDIAVVVLDRGQGFTVMRCPYAEAKILLGTDKCPPIEGAP